MHKIDGSGDLSCSVMIGTSFSIVNPNKRVHWNETGWRWEAEGGGGGEVVGGKIVSNSFLVVG